jgi:tol-pal system protein YbgF
MKIKTLGLISVLLLISAATCTLASERQPIEGKQIKFASSEEEINRVDSLEKEVQNLLSRIEVLEHTISKLEQQLNSINPIAGETVLPLPKYAGEPKSNDIFDVPGTAKTADVSETEIAKDKEFYDLALASLKDNKLAEAEGKFALFIKNYPNSSLQSNAYFWYGETFFRRNMFDKAAINYLKGYKQFPKSTKAADSLLKLALSLGGLNKKGEACSILSKLEAEFPSRPVASIKKTKDAKIKFGCK